MVKWPQQVPVSTNFAPGTRSASALMSSHLVPVHVGGGAHQGEGLDVAANGTARLRASG